MHPVITNGQKITVLVGFYECNPACRGDLVILTVGGRNYVKTVQGIPGDQFHAERTDSGHYALFINHQIVVNSLGIPYSFPDAKARMLLLYEKDYNGIIPPNSYLVLGNDPQGTHDSTLYGLVTSSNIIGKVIT